MKQVAEILSKGNFTLCIHRIIHIKKKTRIYRIRDTYNVRRNEAQHIVLLSKRQHWPSPHRNLAAIINQILQISSLIYNSGPNISL